MWKLTSAQLMGQGLVLVAGLTVWWLRFSALLPWTSGCGWEPRLCFEPWWVKAAEVKLSPTAGE